MFQAIAQGLGKAAGPRVNRDQGVICCLNGSEGCLRGERYCDSAMCDVFEGVNVAIIFSHCFLLLHLWGGVGGIRVNGLQSAFC